MRSLLIFESAIGNGDGKATKKPSKDSSKWQKIN